MSTKIVRIIAILLAISIILGICNLAYQLVMSFVPINTKIVVKEYKKEFKDIDSIKVEVGAASLTIKEGNKIKVEAYNLPSKLNVEKKDKLLVVKQSPSYFNINTGDITIYLPKELKDVDVNGGAGQIIIKDLIIKDLELEIGAGKTEIDNIEAKSADIEGGAGSLSITSSKITDLDLESGAGSVEINSYLYGNSSIECGLGRTNITLLGDEDSYEIKAKKGLGNLIIAGKEYGKEVNYGNGKNKIKIEGGVGEISVRFKK